MGNPMEGFASSIQSGAVTGILTAVGAFAAVVGILVTSFPTVGAGQTGVRTVAGKIWIRRRRYGPAIAWRFVPCITCTGPKYTVYLALGVLPVYWSRASVPTLPFPFEVGPGIKFAPLFFGVEVVSNQLRPMDLAGFDTDVRGSGGVVVQLHVEASVLWSVPKRPFRSTRAVLYGQNDLERQVQMVCANALRAAYEGSRLHEYERHHAEVVAALMRDMSRHQLARYGVTLHSLLLQQVARSPGQMTLEAVRAGTAGVLASVTAA